MASSDPNWWRDDRYAIYDLNVNASVVYPQHEETLEIASAGPSYTAKGYAYAGGGRRITRVEISVDKGDCMRRASPKKIFNSLLTSLLAWRLADIHYAEDKYRDFEGDLFGGKVDMHWRETCFCWCFWSLDIPLLDLENSEAILVRAMDEALSIQPRDMYWSVLGMMNNPWFRVAITKENGVLKFEHPTHPSKPGGWMERVKQEGGDLTNGNWGQRHVGEKPRAPEPVKEISMKKEGVNRMIDLQEFKNVSSDESPWFVVNGEVYDGKGFLDGHPGGAQSIISSAGLDVSGDFLAIRKLPTCLQPEDISVADPVEDSETAKAMMPEYHIGTMDKASLEALSNNTASEPAEPREIFLQQRSWTTATLTQTKTISSDTRILTFQLEHDKQTLGLPIGQHLMLKTPDPTTNSPIIRSYTPISDPSKKGTMDLLIKVYFATSTTPGGKMTTALDKLPIGSSIEFKGPTGRFEYLGQGRVTISGKERRVRSFIMICGGTGITPIFQVLRAVIQDRRDPTTCTVIDGNRREEDILCRGELDAFVAEDSERCQVIHTLTSPPDSWTGLRGRVSEDLLERYAPSGDESMVLVCGPEAMEKSARRILLGQGWSESNLHFF